MAGDVPPKERGDALSGAPESPSDEPEGDESGATAAAEADPFPESRRIRASPFSVALKAAKEALPKEARTACPPPHPVLVRRTRRRRALALLAMAATLVLAHAVAATLLTTPDQLRRRLARVAAERFDADVDIRAVELSLLAGRGRIEQARLRPRAAGEPPGAPPVCEIGVERAIVDHDRLALLGGRYRVRRITAERVDLRFRRARALLDTFQRLFAGGPIEPGETPPPVTIARVVIHAEGDEPVPFLPAGAPATLERVRLTPREPGVWDVRATYRGAELEELAVEGRVDLREGVIRLDIAGSNIDIGSGRLLTLSPRLAALVSALEPSGPVDLRAKVVLPWARPDAASFQGELDCYGLRIAPPGLPRPIADISGRMTFRESELTIPQLRGLYGPSEVRLRGNVRDLVRGLGVEGDLFVRGLELAHLVRLAPEGSAPGTALQAVRLEGRGDLRVSARSSGTSPLAAAEFSGTVALDGASAGGGAVSGLTGEVAFAGEPASAAGEAEGRTRFGAVIHVEVARLLGLEVHDVEGRVDAGPDGTVSLQVEGGTLGGAPFRAHVETGALPRDAADPRAATAALPFRVDAAFEGLPIARALEPLFGGATPLLEGRATGTLLVTRLAAEAAAGTPEVRVEALLADIRPFSFPMFASAGAALGAAGYPRDAFPRGAIRVDLDPGGGGRVRLDLVSPAYTLALEGTVDAAGTLAGRLRATPAGPPLAALALEVEGPWRRPVVRPAR